MAKVIIASPFTPFRLTKGFVGMLCFQTGQQGKAVLYVGKEMRAEITAWEDHGIMMGKPRGQALWKGSGVSGEIAGGREKLRHCYFHV